MRTVLITGSAGLVGSSCVRLFHSKGWEVVGIDTNARSDFFGVEKTSGQLDIDVRDTEKINSLFQGYGFDAIIHAAAQPSHDYSKDHVLEDFDTNARGTLILLEATRKHCAQAVFLYVSTDKVYGERMFGQRDSDENLGLDFAGKRSPFGCSKASADIYVQEYANYFGIKTVCFRPGCITGKNHKGAELHGFLSYLTKCIKEGKPYTIFGDGMTVRDQIHADDLANAFYHYIEHPHGLSEVYNMGGGFERSGTILEMIARIEKETGKKSIIQFGAERLGDRKYDVHDVSKFRSHYPEWDYEYSLQDIIKDVCLY